MGILAGRQKRSSITACAAEGTVHAAGDIAGVLMGHSYYGIVQECFSKGSVNAENNFAGGLIGHTNNSETKNCYSPVFRTFLQHPFNYLIINIKFIFLGVAKILLCMLEK